MGEYTKSMKHWKDMNETERQVVLQAPKVYSDDEDYEDLYEDVAVKNNERSIYVGGVNH